MAISKRLQVTILVVVAASFGAYLLYLFLVGPNLFKSHYLEIMKNLNDPEVKADIRANISQPYNFSELFHWEHERLRWVPLNESFNYRPLDPREILRNGKGRCEEFSILYVSACLALGYDARIVVAENIYTWTGLHVWAEVKFNGSWVHVDPSDSVWNQPSRYHTWDWGKQIGWMVHIFAFEEGKCEDVSSRYK